MEQFSGRVGVVTGAASGIGQALVQALARDGMRLVLADVDEPALLHVSATLRGSGAEALPVRTDVSDRAQVQALAEKAFSTFGAVHLLCNNAGVVTWGGLESATHHDWQWVLGVNLWGVIHGLEAFVPRMIAQRQPGHVLNTASMAGLVATKGLGVYNTSKYAVVGLSETLAKDLAPYGIGVTVLCPMGVSTRIRQAARNRPAHLVEEKPSQADPVQLMGRTLTPEAVAAMTINAIRRNDLYVITHEEGLESIRRRTHRLEQSILGRT